ncbi:MULTISPECIES: hypothetical protein [unclassified Corallococcus]|uniref:hypothetical protein n=1 Tax=unclassified Corallococcus TaxID=2685029 RepID=UPI001A8FCBEA|nr:MULTISPECIES: hypothetical protein [unclassified Corallococcus]MBN9687120.1 hypothetical protein [Corallococcus sp. NCSPR001]WAS89052.1 hypothetical protein O0N60_19220 [Corallococcus sp. NCRR]
MAIYGVATMMHCSPDEVRSWPWSDVVRLMAYNALAREEFDRRVQRNPAASHHASTNGPSTTTTVYRFGSSVAPKR